MKKQVALLSRLMILIALSLWASGCGSEDGSQNDTFKVGLILSGPANDQGWNAIAVQGLNEAQEEFGIESAYTENVEIVDAESALTDYAAQGYDLVIGHGFQYGDPAARVGTRFPNVKFMAIEAASLSENMASYVIAQEQAGYLMGALAALMSQTGTVGIVGGIEMPSIIKLIEAYKLGARSVNPDIEILSVYIGSFTDIALGKEAALSMADQGADVLSHIANQAGTGVIKAAEERGLLATGDSWDQDVIAPDTVICSTLYSVPMVVKIAVQSVRDGSFKGEILNLGMDVGVVDITGYDDVVPQSARDKIDSLKQDIIDGTLQVPIIQEVS